MGGNLMKIRNKTTGEVREITPEEASKYGVKQSGSGNDIEKIINFLTFNGVENTMKSADNLKKPLKTMSGKEIKISKDQSLFENVNSATQATNPVNLLYNFISQLGPALASSGATAATYYGGARLLKALLPYLTYGGINKLKDKLATQDPNAFKGADLQSSLVEKLTAGNKLGNVQSDVQTTINDLLTRRMPNSFSGSNVYNAGDLNQLGQNIGKFEQGYMSGTPGNVVRTAVTDIVKNVAPATKFPYQASAFLNKIGKIPAVGGLLKNPVTWPIAAWGSAKIPKTAKVLLGIQ
jgi:hypothetical protein